MKRRFTVSVSVLLLLSFSFFGNIHASDNLIENPGFEELGWPPSSWNQWDGSTGSGGVTGYISTETSRTGDQSTARVLWGTDIRWGGYTQDIAVDAGDFVRASGWLMSKSGDDPLASGAEAYIEVKFLTSVNGELAVHKSTALTGASDWVRHVIEEEAPTNTAKARFSFVLLGTQSSSTGTVYFDDAHIRIGSAEELAYEHIYYQMDRYYKKSVDFTVQGKDDSENTASLDISDYVTVSDSWQTVEIPLSDISNEGVDLTEMTAFLFIFNDSTKEGTIYVDDMKVVQDDPYNELIIDNFTDAQEHTNNLGYWTSDSESCALSVDEDYVHKLIWDNSGDFWYESVYNGTTPADLSGYDTLSFKIKMADPDTLRLIESYVPTDTFDDNYSAKIYDTALAICALVARGETEDLEHAETLAYALKFCQDNDPTFSDGRLRDAYWSTALEDPDSGDASVKAPGSGCGNLAWTIIAWLRFYNTDPNNHAALLTAAEDLASFIKTNYYDSANAGYQTGYGDWEPNQDLYTYKSTEINATVYAALLELYDVTDDSSYKNDALWAKQFVDEIAWNDTDRLFWAGTLDDGITINTPGLYIDANTLSLLALGELYPYAECVDWIEDNYALSSDGITGYDCNTDLDGIWFKGTAQMAIAYEAIGDSDSADAIDDELRAVQVEGTNANGKGLIVASKDAVTSGWGYPYYASVHIGTTAWFAMLQQGVNPLWGTDLDTDVPHTLGRIRGEISLEGRTDDSATYTFIISEANETTPITGYTPANDEDTNADGIQITVSEDGLYSLIDIPADTYDVSVKCDKYLRETIEDIVVSEGGDVNDKDFGPLVAGDCNGDNAVDSRDATIVSDAMGTEPGDADWDERADVNGDGEVTSADSSLVSGNLNTTGDFGKDFNGPAITIDLPAKESVATYTPITITVSGKIDDDTADVDVNGTAASVSNGEYTATGITISSASNVITVEADDGSYTTTLTRTVTFDTTPTLLMLDDFEDDENLIGEWWDKHGTIVYDRSIRDDASKDGVKALHVEYEKFTGYANSTFGAELVQDGIADDFARFNQVRFWVYAEDMPLTIKLGIEDVNGGLWEKTLSSTSADTWEEFIYDFSGTAIVDFSNVENIIFTADPGDSQSEGEFKIDGLCLVSTSPYIDVEPDAPTLTGPSGPDIYDTYTMQWSDEASSGGTLYELYEDTNSSFTAPDVYFINDLSIEFEGRVEVETYYYKVRAWSALPDEGGQESSWSSTVSVTISDMPPVIDVVESFTSSGDTDNVYESGLLVNINVVEKYEAPDIVSGTIRITSTSESYDSGVQQLALSEDGTFLTYAWDTLGLDAADDYEVNTTLKDSINQEDTDGLGAGSDITIELKEVTAPLLSKLIEESDLSYPAIGMSVNITRTYDHALLDDEPFGKGWTHSYVIRLKEYECGRVDFLMGGGRETSFTPAGGGTYTNKPGVHDVLTKEQDDTFEILKKDGTVLYFDTEGKLTSIEDTNGNEIELSYDANDRLETVTDPSNGEFDFVYKTWTAILESSSPTYTRLDYIEDPAGRKITFGYDNDTGMLTSAQDPLSNTTQYAYNEDLKISTITYPGGGHKYYTYHEDDYGRLASEARDFNIDKRTYTYDANQAKLTVADYYSKETVIYFNEHGRTISITDELENTTYYTWDSNLNRTGIEDPEGNETTFTYDSKGNMLTVSREKDSTTYTTTYTYDSTFNKVASITDAKSRLTTEFDYDNTTGNLIEIVNKIPGGTDYTTEFDYDAYGRLTEKTDPKGFVTEYTYYSNGLLYQEKKRKEAGVYFTTTYVYDTHGNPYTITDAEGKTTEYTYNALNLLLEEENANSDTTTYAYDSRRNLTSITDGEGNATSYTYDTANRLTKVTYEYNKEESYTYDVMSNVTSKTDRNGDTTTYAYDDVYRLTTKTYEDASTVTYTYYDDGTLKDATDANGKTSCEYSEWNELTKVTYPGNVVVEYEYDELGNRTSATYPSGKEVTYSYDIMNRITGVTLVGTPSKVAGYTWDGVSQRTELELPNGSTVEYTYDALNRLTGVDNETSTSSTIAEFTYTLDDVGNRETMVDSAGTHSYTYDDIYQLTDMDYPSSDDQEYVYDFAGNRTQVTVGQNRTSYTVNDLNQYTDVGTLDYTYNDNGCLTEEYDGVDTIYYSYDYDNRLINVTEGQDEIDYTYDYTGRRIETDNNGTVTKYIYDGDRVIAELDSQDDVICEYVYGVTIDEVLFMIKDSNYYYYHYDGLGSVRAITDSSEDIVETYTYDVFGKPTLYDDQEQEITRSSIGNPYYFTGRRFDFNTGLYYYRNRYYHPELGCFMSPDPLGQATGPNLYTYVSNNPPNFIDPLGLCRRGDPLAPADLLKKMLKDPYLPDAEKLGPTYWDPGSSSDRQKVKDTLEKIKRPQAPKPKPFKPGPQILPKPAPIKN